MKKIVIILAFLISISVTGCAVKDIGTQQAYEIRDQLTCNIDATKATSSEEQSSSDTVKDSIDKSVDTSYASFYDTYDVVQYAGMELQVQKVEVVDSIMELYSWMDAEEADDFIQQLMTEQPRYNTDGTLINETEVIVFLQCRMKNLSTEQKYIYMQPYFYGIRTSNHLCYTSTFWCNAFTGRNDVYTQEHLTKAVSGYHMLEAGEEFVTTFICIGSYDDFEENQVFSLYSEGIETYMNCGFLANKIGGNSKINVGEPMIKIFSN